VCDIKAEHAMYLEPALRHHMHLSSRWWINKGPPQRWRTISRHLASAARNLL